MNSATQSEDWRRKYIDAIRGIEQDERRFRDVEKALRQVAGRVCVAAQGQSAQLDELLAQLRTALRDGSDHDVLEQLGSKLVTAIDERDRQVFVQTDVAPHVKTVVEEARRERARVGASLGRVVAMLQADPALAARAQALGQRLGMQGDDADLAPLLEELAALVQMRLQNMGQERQALENLLSQMIARLDDMGSFVANQHADQAAQMESSAVLKTQVSDEMQALGSGVEGSTSVEAIRVQLRQRLDAIGEHLQQFRDREEQRVRASRVRSEQMRERVEYLEDEARVLQQRLQDQQRLSVLDALTQVPNRLAFEQRFAQEFERWRDAGQAMSVVLWDVDHFKSINDRYGHRAGDKVLRIVAETLSKRTRSADFLARYGGEEFVLLLPGAQLEQAVRVANSLREAVRDVGVHFHGEPVELTISGGVTELRAGDTVASVFDRADKALYAAKDGGRDCCITA